MITKLNVSKWFQNPFKDSHADEYIDDTWLNGMYVPALALTALIAVIAFAFSARMLYETAKAGGKTAWHEPYLFTALIDLPIVVFSLAAMYAVAIGKNAAAAILRLLVALFTVLTVYLNSSHAVAKGDDPFIATIAPVVLLISFEVVLWLLKQHFGRQALKTRIDELQAHFKSLESTLQSRFKKLAGNLKTERSQLQNEIQNLHNEYAKTRVAEDTAIKNKTIEIKRLSTVEANKLARLTRLELRVKEAKTALKNTADMNIDWNGREAKLLRLDGMLAAEVPLVRAASLLGIAPNTARNWRNGRLNGKSLLHKVKHSAAKPQINNE